MCKNIIIVEENDGERLDSYIAQKLDGISRSAVQKLIASNNVLLNGTLPKAKKTVVCGDEITVNIPEPEPCYLLPENIPLDIVYEDDYIAVINKQRGLTVHPGSGNKNSTLVNALLFHIKNLSSVGGVVRPGIVHRIDKDTTGLIVVAKCDEAHLSLSRQIAQKTCNRTYWALTEGVMKDDNGIIQAPIGRSLSDRKKMAVVSNGKYAETHYRVLKRFKNNTLVELKLKTGRTHQIRVHLKHIGYPIVGDSLYGYVKQKFNLDGQLLHACGLEFQHPFSKEIMEFKAPLPKDFEKILNSLQ